MILDGCLNAPQGIEKGETMKKAHNCYFCKESFIDPDDGEFYEDDLSLVKYKGKIVTCCDECNQPMHPLDVAEMQHREDQCAGLEDPMAYQR